MVIVDDSIVGNHHEKIIRLIKTAEPAKSTFESLLPNSLPCFYGIDMPTTDDLIASSMDIDSIREYLE